MAPVGVPTVLTVCVVIFEATGASSRNVLESRVEYRNPNKMRSYMGKYVWCILSRTLIHFFS